MRSTRKGIAASIPVLLAVALFGLLARRPIMGDCLTPGDSSTQYLSTLFLMGHLRSVLHIYPWISGWPPVPLICSTFSLVILRFFHLGQHVSPLLQYQLVSCFATCLSIVVLSRAGLRNFDLLNFCVRLLFLLTIRPFTEQSTQGVSAIYAILFIALASLAYDAAARHKQRVLLLGFTGALLFLACFCRTESFSILPAFVLLCWIEIGPAACIPISVPAVLGVILKYSIAALSHMPGQQSFLVNGQYVHRFETAPQVLGYLKLVRYYSKLDLFAIAVAALLLLLAAYFDKDGLRGRSLSRAPILDTQRSMRPLCSGRSLSCRLFPPIFSPS